MVALQPMTHSIHIIGSAKLGGAESFFMRLVIALNASGHKALAVSRPQSLVANAIGKQAPQAHVTMKNQLDLVSRHRISQLIRREQPAIVQTYMTRATILTHLKPDRGVCHIARLGGYYKVKRFAHAHAWIGNTRGICDYLIREGLPARRVFYIGNFVPPVQHPDPAQRQQLRHALGIPDDAWILTAAGRFVHKKGFDTLLAAWENLAGQSAGRPLHLILIGDGPERQTLQQQAAKLKHADRIHWPGWQTDPGPWLSLADLHICPSRHEPLGNVILEGWAWGKPVISTNTAGGQELIQSGKNGVLIPVEDASAMATAIRDCLENENLRTQLATAGQHTAAKQFSQEKILGDYLALYQQLSS